MPDTRGIAHGTDSIASFDYGSGSKKRLEDRGCRHASFFFMDGAGNYATRTLHGCQTGHARTGSAAVDLWHTRACRHRRSRIPDRLHERGTLSVAAYSLPIQQL